VATPTPTYTVLSTASGNVTVSVSTNTWCNKGPGSIYDRVFILYVGQTAKVIGKDQYGSYWVIEKPNNPAVTCWLWGKYATITGDAGSLPVIPAPPTPTPTHPPAMVTAVSVTVDHPVIQSGGSCHFLQGWTTTITTNGPTTVKYYWAFNNYAGIDRTMTFASAGTQSSHELNTENGCGNWVIHVVVTSPNSMTDQVSFKVVSQ
jgi:hypothetical protein